MPEKTKEVSIAPYNPAWEAEFDRLNDMITGYIGDLILGIEHVGSTSVKGLAAKPIIDLDVVIESIDKLPQIIERLGQVGFEHEGNLGVEGREAFKRKYDDGCMKYHLYVCPKDGKGYLEHIAFRDYLRENDATTKEYESLKIRLAEDYRFDVDTYCEKKTEFVLGVLRKTIYKDLGT